MNNFENLDNILKNWKSKKSLSTSPFFWARPRKIGKWNEKDPGKNSWLKPWVLVQIYLITLVTYSIMKRQLQYQYRYVQATRSYGCVRLTLNQQLCEWLCLFASQSFVINAKKLVQGKMHCCKIHCKKFLDWNALHKLQRLKCIAKFTKWNKSQICHNWKYLIVLFLYFS